MYRHDRDSVLPQILTVLGVIALLWALGNCIYKGIRYDQDIGGHLELAAEANNIVIAEEQLEIAITNLDKWNICPEPESDCFTSVLYRTPDDDVAFWRRNLHESHAELESLIAKGPLDNLTESNQLIKLRETLMETGSEGRSSIADPPGISVYPLNVAYAWWLSLSSLLASIGGVWWFVRAA